MNVAVVPLMRTPEITCPLAGALTAGNGPLGAPLEPLHNIPLRAEALKDAPRPDELIDRL